MRFELSIGGCGVFLITACFFVRKQKSNMTAAEIRDFENGVWGPHEAMLVMGIIMVGVVLLGLFGH
jgi:hypothetical protein